MKAIYEVFPNILVQFEDFSSEHVSFDIAIMSNDTLLIDILLCLFRLLVFWKSTKIRYSASMMTFKALVLSFLLVS